MTRGRLAITLTLMLAGCSADRRSAADSSNAAPTRTRDSGMAAMSGMSGAKNSDAASNAIPAEMTFTAAQIQHGGIQWEAVSMGVTTTSASVPGQLVPNEDRTARLGAPAGGRVLAVHVRPGDRVQRGHALVTLASPEAAMAQSEQAKALAELSSRRAQAAYAKSARDRAERLLDIKAIPRQDYERAVADDELARAAVSQAEAELTRARSAAEQLGAVASATGEIVLRAPLSGVVLSRTAVPGTVVEAGAPLAIVTDPTSLWLTVNTPEPLAGLFRAGRALRFVVPAYAVDTFAARIDAIGAGLDPDTRTLPVRAVVNNQSDRLKPEMLATVLVEGGQNVAAAILPDSAVQLLSGRTVVFLVHAGAKGAARFTWRQVELGPRTAGRVSIIRGLATGDTVVTAGAFAVKAQFQKGAMPKMEM